MTTCRLCREEARRPGDFCVACIEAANKRRGLVLVKSRRRDPKALDYDGQWLVDVSANGTVAAGEFGISLADVARYLLGEDDES